MPSRFQPDNLLGESQAFHQVLEHVSQVAPLNKPVLIIGERGTGKELIAERLHYLSKRWDENYVKLNCAALSENLLESELFGHESGAFTGASKRHQGRFERANGGTLFLDELANTSALVQEKLLRVIEYGEYERVGGSRTLQTDVRLICATNEDLPHLASNGEFRADLLDRLAFDVVTLPPLRHRPEDILLLAQHFAVNMSRQLKLEMFAGFSEKAKKVLLSYEWPGNVRELKNVVERSVYRHNNELIPVNSIVIDPFESPYRPKVSPQRTQTAIATPQETPAETAEASSSSQTAGNEQQWHAPNLPLDLKQHMQSYEIDLLQYALTQNQFSQKKTAQALGLSYHQLRGILKKYQLLEKS
ncbi:phage shock protein operon transcriptional activator [Paraferrimonas haliotis]|uniref:Sigma-54-dependent Fis family transcriptional regulator n=1 Tax=Paraferrimonas haliotis TaxID=2013866 RepID=A0AA37TTK7_9GAMM|nr:phage shock protein operon transcriptional activator [Paraferrimonas haliotis]GLS84207.1 sigma-54-dependent Fis family transcriptional regulator [Paraferrimonas haliotis]